MKPTHLLSERPYSAEFYSQGKAEQITDLNKAAVSISDAKESFVAAREEDLKRMPYAVLVQLEPIGRFGDYKLLRTHSSQTHLRPNQNVLKM